MGEVEEAVDHPIIRSLASALAHTCDLPNEKPRVGIGCLAFIGDRVTRFLHVSSCAADFVMQNKMQLGQLTGIAFNAASAWTRSIHCIR